MSLLRPGPAFRLAAALAVALLAGACNTYYIPPAPVSIFINSFNSSLVITTFNSSGQEVPSTVTLQAAVSNSSDSAIIYSVGQDGNYQVGGNNQLGFVDSTGVYTAPLVLPTPNQVTIQATAHADTTKSATTTLTLLNPAAVTTTVTPTVVTVGQDLTFDLVGSLYASGATVALSGAQLGPPQLIGQGEMKVAAHILQPGVLSLSVLNPTPVGPTNATAIRSLPSSPAASSSIAILVGPVTSGTSGTPVVATKAYIPQPANNSLSVVNLDSNTQFATVVMPNGYVPSIAAAHPMKHQVIVASAASNLLQVVDANFENVAQTLTAPVIGTVTVDGQSCVICGLIVDSARDRAILDTASGYFALNLDSGAATPPLAAPAAANFTYDASTQRIYAPFSNSSGSGISVIDLVAGTVTTVLPGNGALFGTGTDSAALDPGTNLVTAGDQATGTYLILNFNSAQSAAGAVQVPASSFSVTNGCAGSWNAMDLDPTSHIGWLANLGECVAVAALPQGTISGPPGPPTSLQWARVPLPPDGVAWNNSPLGAPHSATVFTGANGRAYGLVARSDSAVLLKMDLALMQIAPAIAGGADANQVDPTQVVVNSQTVSALTFIPLH
ncbi:MAG: hypothetical protein ACRD1L_07350 [Terriglobales bacterium]